MCFGIWLTSVMRLRSTGALSNGRTRGIGMAGATGALAPGMLKPRGREYLFNIFPHFCMLFLKLPLFVVMLPTYN